MKISRTVAVFFLAGTVSGIAMGGTREPASAGLQSLKSVCADLSANEQLKPFEVTITCRQNATIWKPVGLSPYNLSNTKEISAAFRVKQYASETSPQAVYADETAASCSILEKHNATAQVDVNLSCKELQTVEDITAYCQEVVDARYEENPAQFAEVATGEQMNTCAGIPGFVSASEAKGK